MGFIVKSNHDGRKLASCAAKSKAIKLAQMMSWDKVVDIYDGDKKVAQYAYGKDGKEVPSELNDESR